MGATLSLVLTLAAAGPVITVGSDASITHGSRLQLESRGHATVDVGGGSWTCFNALPGPAVIELGDSWGWTLWESKRSSPKKVRATMRQV